MYRCWKTKKVVYSSFEDAEKAKKNTNEFILQNNANQKKINHSYQCEHCSKFHVTTLSKRKQKEIERSFEKTKELIKPTKLELISDRLDYLKLKYKI
jgi:hypothetical protein